MGSHGAGGVGRCPPVPAAALSTGTALRPPQFSSVRSVRYPCRRRPPSVRLATAAVCCLESHWVAGGRPYIIHTLGAATWDVGWPLTGLVRLRLPTLPCRCGKLL